MEENKAEYCHKGNNFRLLYTEVTIIVTSLGIFLFCSIGLYDVSGVELTSNNVPRDSLKCMLTSHEGMNIFYITIQSTWPVII